MLLGLLSSCRGVWRKKSCETASVLFCARQLHHRTSLSSAANFSKLKHWGIVFGASFWLWNLVACSQIFIRDCCKAVKYGLLCESSSFALRPAKTSGDKFWTILWSDGAALAANHESWRPLKFWARQRGASRKSDFFVLFLCYIFATLSAFAAELCCEFININRKMALVTALHCSL